MTRDDLLSALTHDNVGAWLHLIREGESSNDEAAFTVIYGGQHFTSFDDHPRIFIPLPNGQRSSAAGAFQITATTWGDYIKNFGPQPFTPENQTLCAVWLTARRRALDAVIGGQLHEAIRLCVLEWTSLGTTKLQAQASSIFAAYGGKETGSSVPVAPVTSAAQTKVEKPMGIFAALLPTILQSLPQLISVFGSANDSEVAKRNQAAGVLVADTLVKATQAVNLQDAVERLNDPQNLAAAHDAINALIPSLVESGGGGIGEARKAAFAPDQTPFWKNPAFIIAALLAPLIYMVAVEILFNPSGQTWSDDIKMMFVTAIVSGLLGSITGFFLGSSLGSQSKNAVAKA